MMRVRNKFFQLLRNPDQDSAKRVWEEFISQEKISLQGTKTSITLEISDDGHPIYCSGWNFADLDFVIPEGIPRSINFNSCVFKSLTFKGGNGTPANIHGDFSFKECSVLGLLDLDIQQTANNRISFEGSKLLGENCKIKIKCTNDLHFANTQFGSDNGAYNGAYELNLDVGNTGIFFTNTKFFTTELLIKTRCGELKFDGTTFDNGIKLLLEGVDQKGNNLSFSNTKLSNFERITFRSFGKIFGNSLAFENCKLLEFDRVEVVIVSKISDCQIRKVDENNPLQLITNHVVNSIFNSHVVINRLTQYEELLIEKSSFQKNLTSKGNGAIVKLVDCDISSYTAQDRAEIIKCTIDLFEASGWWLQVKDKSKIGHLNTGGDTNHLEVTDSTIVKSDFIHSKFSSCAIFSDVTFKEAPRISDIKFSSCNVEFRDVKFIDKKTGVAAGAFRALMKACSDAGYEHGVIFFHALELETRYNYLKKEKFLSGEWLEKIFSFMHKHFTCYGTNLIRPLIILGFIWSLGYCWNMLFFFVNSGIFDSNNTALVSLRNSLGPLMFALPESVRKIDKLHDNLLINIFSFFQIFVSSGIWFVLFFMIRRRFKI